MNPKPTPKIQQIVWCATIASCLIGAIVNRDKLWEFASKCTSYFLGWFVWLSYPIPASVVGLSGLSGMAIVLIFKKRILERLKKPIKYEYDQKQKALEQKYDLKLKTIGNDCRQKLKEHKSNLTKSNDLEMAAFKNKLELAAINNQPTFPISFSKFFSGDDVNRLSKTVKFNGGAADSNAVDWTNGYLKTNPNSVEGNWMGRWNGGGAGQKWCTGTTIVLQAGDFFLFWFDDNLSESAQPYVIIARRDNDRLIGRYVKLSSLEDSTPWIGQVVNNRRIDGYWSQGRWDFRR